ncbi:MAG: phosphoribosylformylglycinamidine synthase subunit PurQ [Deltaproteobacteria bacterium]|nr:phosphoribosylformylglycinamidine synthase subunit PurQ [Deltaproteobacteria bacterium]
MSSPRPVRVLVLSGFGINCEAETAHAFRLAGAEPQVVHVNDLLERSEQLAQAQLLAFPGGFSFGDHLGAGRALANRLRARLAGPLERFIADGGLVLGICNGFQTMVRLGLLPAGRPGPQKVTLAHNACGTFYDGWVTLAADPSSPCVFTKGIDRLELPCRHGEGQLLGSAHVVAELESDALVPLRYVDPATGRPTQVWPLNPNGSTGGMAGLCDRSGRLFGLMPHPEAFLYRENHPAWRRRPPRRGEGLVLFENAVEACRRDGA